MVWLGVLLLGGCESEPGETAPDEPLNILFLFADDQAYDALQALGDAQIVTPNLDRLVARGYTFTHAFNQGSWTGAVCVASRAMLNSGLYLYHARADMERVTQWGEAFRQAGYRTFITGKWHNTEAMLLRAFEEGVSIGRGMYETRGGPAGPGYRRPTPSNDTWSASDTTWLGHWQPTVYDIVATDSGAVRGEPYTVSRHTSELYADRALDFLDAYARQPDRPFFMYVAFNAPHDPRQAPQPYLEMYPVDEMALPPSYLPEHPFDQGERYTLRDEILAPFPRTERAVRTHRREYYAIISHMDAQIGRILDRLDALGLADRTLVVFTADHGLAVGRHGLMGKQNQYDHSIRVPLIFAGPGIEAGGHSDALVYLQSTFATTCELAGVPVPPTVMFDSLVPVLRGASDEAYEAIFGAYRDEQRMIRTDTWKLIVYPGARHLQLFNLQEDPHELTNLAAHPDYAPLIETLYDRLRLLQQDVGDTLPLPEPATLERGPLVR
ncbi:hypothetical protein AWN76_013060 [Rhodothermaceae bacterium RA]|nr:hypothetical protein AWN76_013060 [Rhodothermaceae bacterium RA]